MIVREIKPSEKNAYNKIVTHVIQSWEWGEFRKKMGLDPVRLGHFEGKTLKKAYQLTFHAVPLINKTIGYLPKGPVPDKKMVDALKKIGEEKNCAFIKIEPDVVENGKTTNDERLKQLGLVKSKKTLFTKYNFVVDLTKSEENLLAGLSQKTRYNVNLAKKKGVKVYESTKKEDFEIYLKLYFETTKRQGYFGHTREYHKKVWETLKEAGMANLLIAKYKGEPLVAWMLLLFGDTIYYPYGGSSLAHREVMASNLVAWEAIRLGKKLGMSQFDMWGALGPDADQTDPWYGFHRFKAGYGGKLVEYIGTYDLVLNPMLYGILNTADKIRWLMLKAFRR